jgi:hypothetical protein
MLWPFGAKGVNVKGDEVSITTAILEASIGRDDGRGWERGSDLMGFFLDAIDVQCWLENCLKNARMKDPGMFNPFSLESSSNQGDFDREISDAVSRLMICMDRSKRRSRLQMIRGLAFILVGS